MANEERSSSEDLVESRHHETAIAETTPLLSTANDEIHNPRRIREQGSTWVSKHLFATDKSVTVARLVLLCLIPLINFGLALNTTTSFDIFHHIVCLVWYLVHDPNNVPSGLEDPRCEAPEVKSWFSSMIMI